MKLLSNISVDCVIFGFDLKDLYILVVERDLEVDGELVFKDHTLPGNHINNDETLECAANRILNEVTGLKNIFMKQFKTFSSLDRLQSKNDQLWLKAKGQMFSDRIITTGYYSLVNKNDIKLNPTTRIVNWVKIDEVPELGFDHKNIYKEALSTLQHELMHEPIAFELLPVKFTLGQLQAVYESILGVKFDKRNFRKKISQMVFIIPLNEKQTGVSHKPAQLYMFSKEVYNQVNNKKLGFFY